MAVAMAGKLDAIRVAFAGDDRVGRYAKKRPDIAAYNCAVVIESDQTTELSASCKLEGAHDRRT